MLGWIFRAIARRRWQRRRLLFRFFDGQRQQAVDPIVTAMALHAHGEYLPEHLREAASGDPEATRVVAKTACDIFAVSDHDGETGQGLTVSERVELMMAFDLYMDALKKNTGHLLTFSSSTGETPGPSSDRTTKPMSGSGQTGTEQPSGQPTSTA